MSGLRYVPASQIILSATGEGVHVRAEIIGELTVVNATLRRVFPLSQPETYLSLQDGAGKEVCIVTNLDSWALESKRLADEALERRYFTPRISQIHALKQEAGMWRFTVETQRGPSEFFVRNWRDNSHEVTQGRWHILSVDGGRYEIPDLEALDVKSRNLMDLLL